MSKTPETRSLRKIPSVESLLSRPGLVALSAEFGRELVLDETRDFLAELRRKPVETSIEEALARVDSAVRGRIEERIAPSLRAAVNATGILVHTNLGRAPLGANAMAALVEIARGYSNLELDLETGKRGSRHQHAERLFARLFPGRSAMVANNAAAAVMLALNTFALGKEVVISRGELVEIGGSFRVPEILERSGARLREVGTTNKTRLSDYQNAIGPETGAILRVHPSNFRLVGFTESASTQELVKLGRGKGLPVIEDFGSGNLLSLDPYGVPGEPTVAESLATGIDLCIFSGDKLLGGPQAGILVGEAARVEACRRNPMARALRVDKLVYAALEATLSSYVRGRAFEEIPILRMLALSPEEIRKRCARLVERLSKLEALSLEVRQSSSRVGGGAAPDAEIPTSVISISAEGLSPDEILAYLRRHRPPILARISEDRVLCDLRTLAPEEDAILEEALRGIRTSRAPRS
ncbi:MAG: L-seryl-tRNA(Sec) selenium transferase [Vicinamibacteria bacterium]